MLDFGVNLSISVLILFKMLTCIHLTDVIFTYLDFFLMHFKLTISTKAFIV